MGDEKSQLASFLKNPRNINARCSICYSSTQSKSVKLGNRLFPAPQSGELKKAAE